MTRLSGLQGLPEGAAALPAYRPADHGIGIVHIGIGAFHRAHQAVYTDDALARSGGNWRIMGVSLRSRDVASQLNPQNGFYTLVVRGMGAPDLRVVGSVAGVIFAPDGHARLMEMFCAPSTRIVSLTITEKGYGLNGETGGLDLSHPAIAADLAGRLERPASAIGLITAALRIRHDNGTGPFTVLSCDNLAHNGAITRQLTLEMAERVDGGLARWIAENVTFPSTMVDRITPASTAKTHADVARALGVEDCAAAETEPFSQWIIEDAFCAGRPDWEAGGALMVDDVAPYEQMKLRMLNGAHSMLAYTGLLLGHRHVRDVMADEPLALLVHRHMRAAAATLPPVPGMDLAAYTHDLLARFSNPSLAHETAQIAMDGTQKLPPRIFEAALSVRQRNLSLAPFAFATAAWMAYVQSRKPDGEPYALNDPREAEIAAALARPTTSPQETATALLGLPGFVPAQLATDPDWHSLVASKFRNFIQQGPRTAVLMECRL